MYGPHCKRRWHSTGGSPEERTTRVFCPGRRELGCLRAPSHFNNQHHQLGPSIIARQLKSGALLAAPRRRHLQPSSSLCRRFAKETMVVSMPNGHLGTKSTRLPRPRVFCRPRRCRPRGPSLSRGRLRTRELRPPCKSEQRLTPEDTTRLGARCMMTCRVGGNFGKYSQRKGKIQPSPQKDAEGLVALDVGSAVNGADASGPCWDRETRWESSSPGHTSSRMNLCSVDDWRRFRQFRPRGHLQTCICQFLLTTPHCQEARCISVYETVGPQFNEKQGAFFLTIRMQSGSARLEPWGCPKWYANNSTRQRRGEWRMLRSSLAGQPATASGPCRSAHQQEEPNCVRVVHLWDPLTTQFVQCTCSQGTRGYTFNPC